MPILPLLLALSGCKLGYLAKSGYYQLELLGTRQPVEEVRASGELDEQQLAALDLVADVKAFGKDIGLSATDNYETVALRWKREIWNVSGCDPVSFEPRTWWFPVVGRFPYLGYFREKDARRLEARLQRRGYDVYVRTAGAYSTLGYFKDPILVPMLSWSELWLADTVLHELAHATVWIRGSVRFNESFASFVGETAALSYLEARYGPHSDQVAAARQEIADYRRWRRLQYALYLELDALYADPRLSDADKLARKAQVFDSLDARISAGEFHDPDRFVRAVENGTWNNARLVLFRTYNSNRDWFKAIYEECGRDLLVFMGRIEEITRDADDPYIALEAAAKQARAAATGNPNRDLDVTPDQTR